MIRMIAAVLIGLIGLFLFGGGIWLQGGAGGDDGGAALWLARERGLDDRVHHSPPFGRHRHASSSRRSHMRATAHSRPTVASEMPSASAASA